MKFQLVPSPRGTFPTSGRMKLSLHKAERNYTLHHAFRAASVWQEHLEASTASDKQKHCLEDRGRLTADTCPGVKMTLCYILRGAVDELGGVWEEQGLLSGNILGVRPPTAQENSSPLILPRPIWRNQAAERVQQSNPALGEKSSSPHRQQQGRDLQGERRPFQKESDR